MKDTTPVYEAVPCDDEQPCCSSSQVTNPPKEVPKACCNRRRRMVRFAFLIAFIGYLSYQACCHRDSDDNYMSNSYSSRFPEFSDGAEFNSYEGQ